MSRDTSLWGNVAGPPTRLSPAVSIQKGNSFNGWIKLRLCHAKGRSYFLPDVLIGFGGNKFFLPSFFGPPQLSFNLPDASSGTRRLHNAKFSLDVAAPRGGRAVRLDILFRSDGHVRSYDDGAQLYECTYAGTLNTPLAPLVAGNSIRTPSGDFAIGVFHHTTSDTVDKIKASGELWSGPYNLAGTGRLENVAYTYFSTLPTIENEADLRRIAMSAGGTISYQTTSDRALEHVLDLPVYRSTTADRVASLAFDVPCEIIAPPHLLFHPFVLPNPAYYEVVGSEIVRVAVKPGAKLVFDNRQVTAGASDLKRFEYVVEGDASTKRGLEAPMKEETTAYVAHIEKLDQGLDIFEFWLKHKNSDQVSGRVFEHRKLHGPD